MNRVRIAVKKPGGYWKTRTVEDTLETYQKILGGYLEHFYTDERGIHYFCNEDGKYLELKPNVQFGRDVVVGTIFAVRSDEDGEFASLTHEDLFELFKGEMK